TYPPLLLTHPSSSLLFSHDPSSSEIYTLSLHDALPICTDPARRGRCYRSSWACLTRSTACFRVSPGRAWRTALTACPSFSRGSIDRKSTRLNSSHVKISYAVFCLKKKKTRKH